MQLLVNLTLVSVPSVLLPSTVCQWRFPTIASVASLHVLNISVHSRTGAVLLNLDSERSFNISRNVPLLNL